MAYLAPPPLNTTRVKRTEHNRETKLTPENQGCGSGFDQKRIRGWALYIKRREIFLSLWNEYFI